MDWLDLVTAHKEQNIAAATLYELSTDQDRASLIIQKLKKKNWLRKFEELRYEEVTGHEIIDKILRLAAGFRNRGYLRGQRAVIMQPPGVNFFVLTFACFLYGLIPIFIDPGMDKRSLRRSIIRSKPALFMGVAKAHLARWLLRLCPHRLIDAVLTEDQSYFPGTVSIKDLYSPQFDREDLDFLNDSLKQSSDGIAAILFTSGSTGPAKGAIYTHAMFIAQVQSIKDIFQISRQDVDLATFPLFALFAPALGMPAVVPAMDFRKPAKVQSERIFEAVAKYKVTNFFGSPALLGRLKKDSSNARQRLNSLKRIISAGAPVSHRLIDAFKPIIPDSCTIYTPYGATECMPVAWISGKDVLAKKDQTREGRGIPLGTIYPKLDVRIIRISDETITTWNENLAVHTGQIGEIIVAGPVVSLKYDDQAHADALHKIFDPETGQIFHRIGDLGYFDSEHCLWFCGRKAHRVVINPELTLFSVCVEALFNDHPAVARSALSQTSGKAVLFVELHERKSSKAERAVIISQLRAIAAKHPQAKHIAHFLIHPSFPVDSRHNAKIFREKLGLVAAKKI